MKAIGCLVLTCRLAHHFSKSSPRWSRGCVGEVLADAEIAFGGLNGRMAEGKRVFEKSASMLTEEAS